jgi:hypothetical protein
MLRDSLTAAAVGAATGLTRNAVIGRVSRYAELRAIGFQGVSFADKQRLSKLSVPRKAARTAVKLAGPGEGRAAPADPVAAMFPETGVRRKEVSARVKEAAARATGRGNSLTALKPQSCKYPVNDPERGKAFIFCGEPVDPNAASPTSRSYCATHGELCAVPAQTHAKRRPVYA